MEAFSVDSPVAVMEAPKSRVGASRSPPRTIEAVQRRRKPNAGDVAHRRTHWREGLSGPWDLHS